MKIFRLVIPYLVALFTRKKKTIGFLAIGIIFLALGFFKFQGMVSHPEVSEGLVGTYQEKDLPDIVLDLVSDSLVKVDKTGTPKPNLAEGWEANQDATEYKVKLKDNLYWSDGTKIKVSDIDLSIPGASAKVLDDRTLEFKLSDSFSPFPTLLDKPIIKKDTLIGTGPYMVQSVKKDGIFVRRINLVSTDKALPRVVIKLYPNERIAKEALKLGEINALMGVNEPGEFLTQKNYSLWSKDNLNQVVTIFYNTKDQVLSDNNFRIALSFAAPSIKDGVEARTSIPSTSWAFNPDIKDYLDNPEQAKVYLNKVKNGRDNPITLTVVNSLKSVGEQVVSAWNKQGIKSVLRVESGIPQNFQALLITQNIPADPDQYSLWHSTQTQTNISKVSLPRVDKDLEDGRKTTDLETRKLRYQDFQRVLIDNAPATFLYFPKYNVLYLKKVKSELEKVLALQIQ